MEQYVGTGCIDGRDLRLCSRPVRRDNLRGRVASRPKAIAKMLWRRAPTAYRIAFETGSLSNWLWHELKALGFLVLCLDARHARAALSMRMNKSDRNAAHGLAEMARVGWYHEAKFKSMESRQVRATLAARAKLVDIRRDIENQLRGLLKSLGIVLGKASARTFPSATLRQAPHLRPLIEPLLLAHSALITQILKYDVQNRDLARSDQTVSRLMTVSGVGPVTALALASAVDDPKRFRRASDVDAYLGLTIPPGDINRASWIEPGAYPNAATASRATTCSKQPRTAEGGSTWGAKLAKRIGSKKAKITVARKMAVILHCIWTDAPV